MEKWQLKALEEIYLEIAAQNPLINAGVKYTEFVSRSNGRNRNKRKPREVRLVSYGGRTISIGNSLSKRLEFLMQEIYPENLIFDGPNDWLTSFVNALKEADLLAKKLS